MATKIEIINSAIADCGEEPIDDLGDATKATVRIANAKYTLVRDAVIEDREWTFAKGRRLLAKDATAPLFGYTFQYIITSEVLRVIRCRDGNGDPLADFVREGWRILTNDDSPIYAEVLTRVDEATFSPGMVQALSARLTSVFAIPLTENRQLAKDYWDIYKDLLSDAGAMDGSQGRTQQLTPPPLPGRRAHGVR